MWGNIQEQLDRGLTNSSWLSKLPDVRASHLARVISNHYPILIDWSKKRNRSGNFKAKKLFRFEALWSQEENCVEIVRNAWVGSGVSPTSSLS